MKSYLTRIKFLLASYLLALFLLSFARILFFAINKTNFAGISTSDFVTTLFYGLHFDVITITIINALFIFLVVFPVSFFQYRKFRTTLKVVFISTNLIALALNMVDMAYFPFTLRRSTANAFLAFSEA